MEFQVLGPSGILDQNRELSVAATLGRKRANLEDMFTPGEYVKLYNGAFGTRVKAGD